MCITTTQHNHNVYTSNCLILFLYIFCISDFEDENVDTEKLSRLVVSHTIDVKSSKVYSSYNVMHNINFSIYYSSNYILQNGSVAEAVNGSKWIRLAMRARERAFSPKSTLN